MPDRERGVRAPNGICEGAGLVKWCSGTCGRGRGRSSSGSWCCGVPHQGVLLRGGSVARHLSAPVRRMVRSGHDPQGLNQLVDVAVSGGRHADSELAWGRVRASRDSPLLKAADLAVA